MPEVKQTIINKLKSAKYILPSVKIALDNFFNNGLKYTSDVLDDEGKPEIVNGLNKEEIKEYTDSYKDV